MAFCTVQCAERKQSQWQEVVGVKSLSFKDDHDSTLMLYRYVCCGKLGKLPVGIGQALRGLEHRAQKAFELAVGFMCQTYYDERSCSSKTETKDLHARYLKHPKAIA